MKTFSLHALILIAISHPVFGQTPSPAESGTSLQREYLEVHNQMNEANNRINLGDEAGALSEFKKCSSSLEAIHNENANWEPALITHLMDICKSKIAQISGHSQDAQSDNNIQVSHLDAPASTPNSGTSSDSVGTAMSQFETDIIGTLSPNQKQLIRVPDGLTDLLTPSFSDILPDASFNSGKSAGETVQFINRKIIGSDRIIYYDKQLKTFVYGQPLLTRDSRLVFNHITVCYFNPGDLNPDKVIKASNAYSSGLRLFTTNNQNVIRGFSINITAGGFTSVNGHELDIPLEDDSDAQSVCNAFVHLMQLYGGKSDDF